MPDRTESYVTIPAKEVRRRADQRLAWVKRQRRKDLQDLFDWWVKDKNTSWWRRLWRRPQVTLTDAKIYYKRTWNDTDEFLFLTSPARREMRGYEDDRLFALQMKRMAQLAIRCAKLDEITTCRYDSEPTVQVSRSDFNRLGF